MWLVDRLKNKVSEVLGSTGLVGGVLEIQDNRPLGDHVAGAGDGFLTAHVEGAGNSPRRTEIIGRSLTEAFPRFRVAYLEGEPVCLDCAGLQGFSLCTTRVGIHLLDHLGKKVARRFRTPSGVEMISARLSPDRKMLAIGWSEGVALYTIGEFLANRGDPTLVWRQETTPAWALDFSPDGAIVFVQGYEQRSLVRVSDGVRLKPVPPFDADGLHLLREKPLLWSKTGSPSFLDPKTWKPQSPLSGIPGAPRLVSFSGNGRNVAITAPDGLVQVWNLTNGRLLWETNLGKVRPGVLYLHPDGTHLIIGVPRGEYGTFCSYFVHAVAGLDSGSVTTQYSLPRCEPIIRDAEEPPSAGADLVAKIEFHADPDGFRLEIPLGRQAEELFARMRPALPLAGDDSTRTLLERRDLERFKSLLLSAVLFQIGSDPYVMWERNLLGIDLSRKVVDTGQKAPAVDGWSEVRYVPAWLLDEHQILWLVTGYDDRNDHVGQLMLWDVRAGFRLFPTRFHGTGWRECHLGSDRQSVLLRTERDVGADAHIDDFIMVETWVRLDLQSGACVTVRDGIKLDKAPPTEIQYGFATLDSWFAPGLDWSLAKSGNILITTPPQPLSGTVFVPWPFPGKTPGRSLDHLLAGCWCGGELLLIDLLTTPGRALFSRRKPR